MSDDEQEYILYRHRPEWNDIKPIPQEDGSNGVVQIAYSEKFKDVFDYFRAILAKNEKSERALKLTQTAISFNPANYTVWQFRREILRELDKDLSEEMDFLSKIITEQQKNYQVWHHRRALVEWSRDASEEMMFTARIINHDHKNYHAWQHRQWVIKEFDKWENELKYVEALLHIDLRNNSAWNQRFFVIKHTTGFTDDVLENEINYTLKKIDKALHNESAWNYLRGILKLDGGKGLNWSENVRNRVASWRNENIQSPQFLSFVLSMIEESLETETENVEEKICDAEKVVSDLRKVDTVRRKYWNLVLQRIQKKYLE